MSAKKDGLATMTALEQLVLTRKVPKRPNKYAKAIMEWLGRNQYQVQVVEMPVVLPWINRVTRADLVTLTRDGTGYIIWEIKCGWPPGAHRGTYKMARKGVATVPCNAVNMFHLQAMYTKVGAMASGLKDVKAARVLHVFEAEYATDPSTPPAQRKRPAAKTRDKETWEQNYGKPVVAACKGGKKARFEKVMRVVAMEQPQWCVKHEDALLKNMVVLE